MKFSEILENNKETLRCYEEGVSELKRYELHSALKKENKKYLIDIYYDVNQMNKWRDSCARSQDHMKSKFERLEKDYNNAKQKI